MMLQAFLNLANPFAQSTPFGTSGSGNFGSVIFIVVLFAFIAARRIMWSTRGRRYTTYRVLYSPIIYVIITLIVILPLEYNHPIALTSFAAAIPGFIIGSRFGRSVQFFQQNGFLYYKRSPVVMVIWLVSALVRVILFYGFTLSFYFTYLVDLTLVLTTGMLAGESIHILRERGKLKEQENGKKDDEGFSMMKEL